MFRNIVDTEIVKIERHAMHQAFRGRPNKSKPIYVLTKKKINGKLKVHRIHYLEMMLSSIGSNTY